MIDKLAKLPLLYQPGKGWTYSLSMDIQGYIVEKLSGKSLPDFMRDNIFTPLGMKDTDFYVPAEKRSRFTDKLQGNARWRNHARQQRAAARRPTTWQSRRWPLAAAAW